MNEELLEQLEEYNLLDITPDEAEWLQSRMSKDPSNLDIYLTSINAGRQSNNLAKLYKQNEDYLDPITGIRERLKTSLDNGTSVLNGLFNVGAPVAAGAAAYANPLAALKAFVGGAAGHVIGDKITRAVSDYPDAATAIADKLGISKFTSEFVNPFTITGASLGLNGNVFLRRNAAKLAKFNSLRMQASIHIPDSVKPLVDKLSAGMDTSLRFKWIKEANRALANATDMETAVKSAYKVFAKNNKINNFNKDVALSTRADRYGMSSSELMDLMESKRFKGTEDELLEILKKENKDFGLGKTDAALTREAREAFSSPTVVTTADGRSMIVIDQNQPSIVLESQNRPRGITKEDVFINEFLHEFSHAKQYELGNVSPEFTRQLLKEINTKDLYDIFRSPQEMRSMLLDAGINEQTVQFYMDNVFGKYLNNPERGLTEDIARIGQMKDWLGLRANEDITPEAFDKFFEYYSKLTGEDNLISAWSMTIKDPVKFLRLANSKLVKNIVGMVLSGLLLKGKYNEQTEQTEEVS